MKRLVLLFVLAACSTSNGGATPAADAGDDGGDLVFVCPNSGVSKGPWSLHVDGTSAVVRWEACRPDADGSLKVTARGASDAKTFPSTTTMATTTVVHRALTVAAPPDLPGTWYMHDAQVTGLSPGTCYDYALGADASLVGSFCTSHASGEPFRFMAIGDTNPGLGDSTKNVLAHVLPMNPELVLHGGDIEYYDSLLDTWAYWFTVMQPMLSKGAFFPAIGNHESETPDEFDQYTERFFHGAGFDGTDSYFRFQDGGVWFFSVDTEQPLDPSSTQGAWLTQSLADAVMQPGFRFSVVFFHKPFVTCGDTGDNPAARAYYAPIFKQDKVLLVLQAHMHGYERFQLDDLTYVTTAGGGGDINDPNQNVNRAYCNQRVASGGFFHATILDVTATGLTGTVVDDQGMTRDTFTIAAP